MKRAWLALFGVVVVVGCVAAAAWLRPDLVPAWARFGPAKAGASADSGLFCDEHGVPEKFCTLCHPELEKTLLLCKEHGDIPEDICTLCHPEVAEKHGIKPCEHGLPKHFCVQCTGEPHASNAVDDGWCAAHNRPEATCEECEEGKPKLADGEGATCRNPLPLVRFASAELAETVGVETAEAKEEQHDHFLGANAETDYDANRYAEVSPRVSGFLREVRADLGKAVEAGEVLAVVDSAEVSAAKSQYLSAEAALKLARDTFDRTQSLAQSNAVAPKDLTQALATYNQAEAAMLDARQKLRNFGFAEGELARILRDRDTGSELPIVSPIAGTVVVRHAVRGEAVQATSQLFAVSDMSTMWLWVDVYEADIGSISTGQEVAFTISGTEGPPFPGRVTWVGTEVNDRTRTTRVRADLANPDGRLRANQFGRAQVRVGPEHDALVVPKDAVQRKDGVDVVFLPVADGRYRPQRVVTKASAKKGHVEITWGLKPGDRVVTTGAFLLKTEITKGAIGAGCCE
jgi:cobalt-zinc-cadmium efflux system membrane fusion protein